MHLLPHHLNMPRGVAMIAGSERLRTAVPFGVCLDGYLAWIEANSRAWTKLMQSAATLPEAGELIESFRTHTLEQLVLRLTGRRKPRPALRNALKGWLGYSTRRSSTGLK